MGAELQLLMRALEEEGLPRATAQPQQGSKAQQSMAAQLQKQLLTLGVLQMVKDHLMDPLARLANQPTQQGEKQLQVIA